MKKTTETIKRDKYEEECPFCKPTKTIKGTSEKLVKYNLKFHIERKHKGEKK